LIAQGWDEIVCRDEEGAFAMTGRFDDKVVLLTGAASGIGAATVRRFAREGARVLLGDINDAAGAGAGCRAGRPRRVPGQAVLVLQETLSRRRHFVRLQSAQ
jgi:NAD(P)-dependent dehydrogenase (short-subunit alcohol dehydrogenase family)